MSAPLCVTCGVEHAPGVTPPRVCAICADERQYVLPSGQRWTTLAELEAQGHAGVVAEVEPRLFGITVSPRVGIGQRALLAQTPHGNLLWDPTGYVDDDLTEQVAGLGGVQVIATSHPHMFGVQVEWSRRFGSVPVYVAAADQEWVQRPDPAIQLWSGDLEVLPGITLHQVGGHFPGSAVALLDGHDGKGVLLSGDTVAPTPDERWVSFLRSYPNQIPLSAATVGRIAARLAGLDFDRLHGNVGGRTTSDAGAWVQRSAERYTAWVRGDFDHLT